MYKFVCKNCKREWTQVHETRKFCNRCGSPAVENLTMKSAQQSFAPDGASLLAPDDMTGALDDSVIGELP